MNRDEQAKRMLNEPADSWPEGARKLRLPLESLPEHVRAAVAARTAQAVANDKTRTRDAGESSGTDNVVPLFKQRKFLYAAAAIFVATLSAYITLPLLFPGSPAIAAGPDFIRGRGDFTIERDGKTQVPAGGMKLNQGHKLVLKNNADVLLKRGNLSVYINGPAILEIRPPRDNAPRTLLMFLNQGALVVRSAATPSGTETKHPDLEILTRRAGYTLAGTFARLTTSLKGERIAVLNGAFRVKGVLAGVERRVSAGKALAVPADPGETMPAVIKISPEDRKALNAAGADMNTLGSNKIVINESLSFADEDEILKYYGSISQLELKDGQSYRGFAVRTAGRIRIHTTLGVVTVRAANMDSLKIIKTREGN